MPSAAATLPDVAFLRLPAVLAVYPVGRSTWWQMVREGRAPQPVKLSPGVTAWLASDIRAFLEEKSKQAVPAGAA